ncbi:thiamin pyrophosphokinase 1-like isoform X2 [Macrobrachium nipponense]|uniref:thiamin pyrophosphokinase 1-like isoform X2 n=1 Tax=Macrobrachium nipponense TaxID=159736 RepID=UPI0030C85C51
MVATKSSLLRNHLPFHIIQVAWRYENNCTLKRLLTSMEDETGRLWWDVSSFYQPPQDCPYAVMLLNEALDHKNQNFFMHIWSKASVRVCVDGATNCFHKFSRYGDTQVMSVKENGQSPMNCDSNTKENGKSSVNCDSNAYGTESLPLPHIISGDFDSVHPDLLTHYKELDVNIIPTPNQEETDFTKAVRELAKYITARDIQLKHIVVIAAVCNERFDHVIANLSTLYKVEHVVPVPVIVVSGASLFWLLSEGDHTIQVSQEIILNPLRSWCGLVPLGYPATVTTKGLKWNLDNQILGFGHLVSTSNTYDPTHEGQVTITTCQPLLWTMGWDIDQLYPVENCMVSKALQEYSSPGDLVPAMKAKCEIVSNQ